MTTHTKKKQSGENSDDPRRMEMAKTLVDYSVDGSAWVDVFFCYRACRAVQLRKTNSYTVGYSFCYQDTAWRRVESSSTRSQRSKARTPATATHAAS